MFLPTLARQYDSLGAFWSHVSLPPPPSRFPVRFAPDKGFEGADRSGGAPRTGPVQFERQEEFDPFGINQFLSKAKQASKRPGDERRDDRDKRRRH